jgi:hypothetical protein
MLTQAEVNAAYEYLEVKSNRRETVIDILSRYVDSEQGVNISLRKTGNCCWFSMAVGDEPEDKPVTTHS